MEGDKTIALSNVFTKERKALPDLLYLNMEYFEVSNDYKMKQLDDIVVEVRKGLKAGKVLKSILEYLEISDGRSKFFSRMCQYVFKNVPSISCVGNRKQQRIFLGMFIKQYDPSIFRDHDNSLWEQVIIDENEEDDNEFMKDLRLSRYILDHHLNSTICTWSWLYQKLSEKNRTRFRTPDEFSSYFCTNYPEIHDDHIDMCRPQETLIQWIKETPITVKNSNVYRVQLKFRYGRNKSRNFLANS